MKGLALVVAALALAGSRQQAPATPPTPQECVTQARTFMQQRMKELSPLTSAIYASIDRERVEKIRACGARFDVEKASGQELTGLIEYYTEAQQPDLAERALTKALSEETTPADRASRLASGVRMLLRQPKSDARNAKAESYIDRLDALDDDVLDQKVAAHAAMNNYYRADDIDAGIIRHSTWLIAAGKRPEVRKKFGSAVVNAYINLAEAYAGQGENDKALDLLKRARVELADLPNVERMTTDELARYELVGTRAAPIAPVTWINRDPAAGPLDLKGPVTLVQFTAHWCGPCKESYPGMQRLRQRFKGRPFQVVFHTRTYGFFENERPLTPEQEIARDRTYFAGHGFDIPIAVGVAEGRSPEGKPIEDPVEQAFHVSGIPQINVIDRNGRIRLIMIGYDDANEERLAGFIQKLLAEK